MKEDEKISDEAHVWTAPLLTSIAEDADDQTMLKSVASLQNGSGNDKEISVQVKDLFASWSDDESKGLLQGISFTLDNVSSFMVI